MPNVEEALNQAAAELESGKTGGESAEAIEGKENSTADGDSGNELGVKVPVELQEKEKELLKAFHAKTQALAEKERQLAGSLETYKQDAATLYDLAKQEWFKTALESEKQRRSGRQVEISDDAFEAIKSDKRAFQEFLANRDKSLSENIKSQFKAEFEKLGKSQQEIMTSREFEAVAGKYGEEFIEANKADALEPYLSKNYDYETSFKLYMQDQGKVAGKKSEAPPKKAGVVEKGGMANVRGGLVVKVKNMNDALDRAFDLSRRGVKDYRFEKE